MNKLNFDTELEKILKIYNEEDDEPLDGDGVEKLVKHIRNKLNLIQGNITQAEFIKLENRIKQ